MKTENPHRWLTLMAAILIVPGACAEPADEEDGAPTRSAELTARVPTLEVVQAVGVPNAAMPLDNIVTSAQPTEEQLSALVDLGYTHFISLRPSTEEGAGWEEGIAADYGIHFTRIPVVGPAELTRENALELDRVLTEVGEEGVVVYDADSDRVGALLALRAHWLEGADPQAALELGRRAGLSRLEPTVAELFAMAR